MQKPWVAWSSQRFFLTMAPLVASLLVVRIVLFRSIESETLGIAAQVMSIMVSAVVLYVVFT